MVDFTIPSLKKTVFETFEDKVGSQSGSLVESNFLHRFASYNYVLTLSALKRSQMDQPDEIPNNPPYNIIARTGGIGNPNVSTTIVDNLGDATIAEKIFKNTTTEEDVVGESQRVLEKGRDIYFNSCTISSFPRPNEFRKLMNYTKIEMVMEEPNGITFWEKCRAAAFNSGYLNHTTAPFLLTIEFKGFDSSGKEVLNAVPKRVYPIRLSRSSLRMNAGSTTYTVEAYPWTEFGAVNAFLYTRSSGRVNGTGTQLNEILKNFAKELSDDIEENEKDKGLRALADTYEITADTSIGRIETLSDNQYPVSGPFGLSVNRFSAVSYEKNQSIVKILEDLVRQYKKYNDIEKILSDKVKSFTPGSKISEDDQYVSWFKIITTIKEEKEFDKILKTHRRTIKYHIKEFKVHVLNFVKAGFGFSFDYERAVRKVFNYIYTGENLDILDLNVEYNAGYYQSILRKQTPTFLENLANTVTKKVTALFGDTTYEADELLPLSQYVTTLTTDAPNIQPQNDTGYTQPIADAQYDYLVNPKGDMVTVEMKIMGDPAFLGQDYAIPMKIGETSIRAKIGANLYDTQLGAFNFDNGEVIVKLNFRFPSDFNENTGLYQFNSETTPQFSGLYRIIRVESTMENGQFTQMLTMARCMNQKKVSATLSWAGEKSNNDNPVSFNGTSDGTAGDIAGEARGN